MPQTENAVGDRLPPDTASLIEYLARTIPPPIPDIGTLGTEDGRIRLAHDMGRREVVTMLRCRIAAEAREA